MAFLRLVVLMACFHRTAAANSALYYNHWNLPTYSSTTSTRSRRSRAIPSDNLFKSVLVSRKGKRKAHVTEKEPIGVTSPPEIPVVSFDDLGPVGKAVAGVTQITVTTLLEYCSGFFAGYFLGTVVGTPGLLFRPMEKGVPKMLMAEAKGRLGRMNSRSMTWATGWGGISAAFGGFKVVVRVIRNGKEDDWNQILSSAAAGAFFARTGELVNIVSIEQNVAISFLILLFLNLK
jgi:hypothetical protein